MSDLLSRAVTVFQTRRQNHAFHGWRFDRGAMIDSIARELRLSETEREQFNARVQEDI